MCSKRIALAGTQIHYPVYYKEPVLDSHSLVYRELNSVNEKQRVQSIERLLRFSFQKTELQHQNRGNLYLSLHQNVLINVRLELSKQYQIIFFIMYYDDKVSVMSPIDLHYFLGYPNSLLPRSLYSVTNIIFSSVPLYVSIISFSFL